MFEYMHTFWILPKTISQYYKIKKKQSVAKMYNSVKNNNEK